MNTSPPLHHYTSVDQQRPYWIRKLIDVSRRNNLLYFRARKTSTLDFGHAPPEASDDLFANKSVKIKRFFPANEDPKLYAIARAIARKSLENNEEKGLETLFLAIGIVTWPASDGGRAYEAPLILLPVVIENFARDDSMMAIRRQGEPQINLTLLQVFAETYQVKIDPMELLDESAEQFDPSSSYDRLQAFIQPIPHCDVQDRRYLGNFSFQKMAMVQDLMEHGEALAQNPLVAALAGDGDARTLISNERGVVDPRRLDRQPMHQEPLILDADSSQRSVIAAVLAGQSGAIQGPPGTGKSQTIANLIAAAIAKGKRILFVAEKRAALDVVAHRLQSRHLGHIILDLHGADLSRRVILQRVAESLERVTQTPNVNLDRLEYHLQERRQQLNDHVVRLHKPIQPANLSPFQLRGLCLQLSTTAKTSVRWRGPQLHQISEQRADALRAYLQEASTLADILYGTNTSPWIGARIDPGFVQQHIDKVQWLLDALPRWWQRVKRDLQALALQAPTTLRAIQDLEKLSQRADALLDRYTPALFSEALRTLLPTLAKREGHLLGFWWNILASGAFRRAIQQVQGAQKSARGAELALIADLHAAVMLHDEWGALVGQGATPQPIPVLKESTRFLSDVTRILTELEAILPSLRVKDLPIDAVIAHMQRLADDRNTPVRIEHLNTLLQHLSRLGADALVADIRHQQPDPATWSAFFDLAWYQSCLEEAQRLDPALDQFNGQRHNQVVSEFVRDDKQVIEERSGQIARNHAETVIATMNAFPEQEHLIRREAKKKARHLPLRKLLALAPDVLLALYPCWMASPLTVSQLIGADRTYFDLIIFDEASQVLPEDAIPSILRGKQLVVAGDAQQLPPTTFFADRSPEDDEDEPVHATEGLESLLDLVSVTFPPDWQLEWHYRSRDERLIAFANHYIYQDRLVTFPGANLAEPIRFIEVPWAPGVDGQEESSSAEVRKVVDLIIDHARNAPGVSLGVITMGMKHAVRIQAQLDHTLHQESDLDEFFATTRAERFFIKSIEQVQGDERDAIILSVGYGKDRTGKLRYTFGPINNQGGERRLNVAVTRARQSIIVVASFNHFDMDPKRSMNKGTEFLRNYLEYAHSGGRLLGERADSAIALNPFELDVADALRRQGMHLLPQWGVSKFRIDFAVQHPQEPGRFLLAIECDGATYHAAPTARDRDRLRQQHLESLGWRFHRIWSTDWFFRRDEEIARAVAAYRHALGRIETQTAAQAQPERQSSAPTDVPMPSKRPPRPRLIKQPNIDAYNFQDLVSLVRWFNADGNLRTDEELLTCMIKELGFKRRGTRIDAVVREAIAAAKA